MEVSVSVVARTRARALTHARTHGNARKGQGQGAHALFLNLFFYALGVWSEEEEWVGFRVVRLWLRRR